MKKLDEFVINWHILWNCNFQCEHCFTKYNERLYNKKPIIYNYEQIDKLLYKLSYFSEKYSKLRLNIAGGEPLLSNRLKYIINKAYSMKYNVSLITNAYLMNDFNRLNLDISKLKMIGFSIDSLIYETNIKTGRCTKTHDVLTKDDITNIIRKCREINPDIKIKINTVVTHHNYMENFSEFISSINPYKWKIFQAVSLDKNKIYCKAEEYRYFLNTHKELSKIIYAESIDELHNSYVMVDPYGRFFQHNDRLDGYIYSDNILYMDSKSVKSIKYDEKKYCARYENYYNQKIS